MSGHSEEGKNKGGGKSDPNATPDNLVGYFQGIANNMNSFVVLNVLFGNFLVNQDKKFKQLVHRRVIENYWLQEKVQRNRDRPHNSLAGNLADVSQASNSSGAVTGGEPSLPMAGDNAFNTDQPLDSVYQSQYNSEELVVIKKFESDCTAWEGRVSTEIRHSKPLFHIHPDYLDPNSSHFCKNLLPGPWLFTAQNLPSQLEKQTSSSSPQITANVSSASGTQTESAAPSLTEGEFPSLEAPSSSNLEAAALGSGEMEAEQPEDTAKSQRQKRKHAKRELGPEHAATSRIPMHILSVDLHPTVQEVLSFFTLPKDKLKFNNLGYSFCCFRDRPILDRMIQLLDGKRISITHSRNISIMFARMHNLEDLRASFRYYSNREANRHCFWFDDSPEQLERFYERHRAVWGVTSRWSGVDSRVRYNPGGGTSSTGNEDRNRDLFSGGKSYDGKHKGQYHGSSSPFGRSANDREGYSRGYHDRPYDYSDKKGGNREPYLVDKDRGKNRKKGDKSDPGFHHSGKRDYRYGGHADHSTIDVFGEHGQTVPSSHRGQGEYALDNFRNPGGNRRHDDYYRDSWYDTAESASQSYADTAREYGRHGDRDARHDPLRGDGYPRDADTTRNYDRFGDRGARHDPLRSGGYSRDDRMHYMDRGNSQPDDRRQQYPGGSSEPLPYGNSSPPHRYPERYPGRDGQRVNYQWESGGYDTSSRSPGWFDGRYPNQQDGGDGRYRPSSRSEREPQKGFSPVAKPGQQQSTGASSSSDVSDLIMQLCNELLREPGAMEQVRERLLSVAQTSEADQSIRQMISATMSSLQEAQQQHGSHGNPQSVPEGGMSWAEQNRAGRMTPFEQQSGNFGQEYAVLHLDGADGSGPVSRDHQNANKYSMEGKKMGKQGQQPKGESSSEIQGPWSTQFKGLRVQDADMKK